MGRNYSCGVVVVVALLCGGLVVGCAPTRTVNVAERQQPATEAKFQHWMEKQLNAPEKLHAAFPNDFVGVGVAFGANREEAIQGARLVAIGELVKTIKIQVSAVIKLYHRENQINNRSVDEEDFQTITKTCSDVHIRDEVYVERDSFVDNQGRHHLSVLALKNRQEYFNDYMKLIDDEKKQACDEIVRFVKRKLTSK